MILGRKINFEVDIKFRRFEGISAATDVKIVVNRKSLVPFLKPSVGGVEESTLESKLGVVKEESGYELCRP